MSQILIRDLSPDVVKRLKRRAKASGRSLQAEAKRILEDAATTDKLDAKTALALADRFRRSLGRKFDDSTVLIREDRDR